MARDYRNLGIDELEALAHRKAGDPAVLAAIRDELTFRARSRRRAENLAKFIESKLADLSAARQPEAPPTAPAGRTGRRSGVEGHAEEAVSRGRPPAQDARPAPGETGSHALGAAETGGPVPQEDRYHSPLPVARMRPTGSPGHFPSPYRRDLDDTLKLDVPEGAPLVQCFAPALEAQIAAMKQAGNGQTSVTLENGQLRETLPDGALYTFPYRDDAALFDNASIFVSIDGGADEDGHVAAVNGGTALIKLEKVHGQTIGRADIRLSNTSLIEALKERIEHALEGTVEINRAIADCLTGPLERIPDVEPIAFTGPGDRKHPLNEGQLTAIEKALKQSVTIIWGPPGTGKTESLALIVRDAVLADKRVLIASNTNKAVDQLIYRMCTEWTVSNPLVTGGAIVRTGHITDDKLEAEYRAYVDPDKIAERKSKELDSEKKKLERKLAEVDAEIEKLDIELQWFDAVAGLQNDRLAAQEKLDHALKEQASIKKNAQIAQAKIEQLKTELSNRNGIFARCISRKPEEIQRDIRAQELEIVRFHKQVEWAEGPVAAARRSVTEIEENLKHAQARLPIGVDVSGLKERRRLTMEL